MQEYYKVLDRGRKPYHGGSGTWSRDWESVEGTLVPCEHGLHVLKRHQLVEWLGPEIWVVEVDESKEVIYQYDKVVVRRARLVKRAKNWNARTQRLFACDCVEHVMKENSDPRCWNAIKVARKFANGKATRKELTAAYIAAKAATPSVFAADYHAVIAVTAAAAAAAAAPAKGLDYHAAKNVFSRRTILTEIAWQTNRLFEYIEV